MQDLHRRRTISKERAFARATLILTRDNGLTPRKRQYEATAAELQDAPAGWKPVSQEAQILATLRAPIEGSKHDAFAQKERALKAVLAQLSPVESSHLAARLTKGNPNDPIAVAFGRLTIDRRGRILTFLGDARRRAAIAQLVKSQSPAVETATSSDASNASRDSPKPDDLNAALLGDPAIEPVTTLTNPHASELDDSADVVVDRSLDARMTQFDDLFMIARRRALAHRLARQAPQPMQEPTQESEVSLADSDGNTERS
jgi:hypothetical protein